jgi:drug/metabolite transporter (DMT)-like permease
MRKTISTTRSNLLLYLTCVLIWGSTWLVIKFQIDSVTPLIGVFYRFILASGLLFGISFIFGRNLKFSRFHHLIFFFQGTCNFSLNYVLTYEAEIYSPSAIIALTYTTLVHMNIIGSWLFYRKSISKNVIFGALFGALGVFYLFYEDLMNFQADSQNIKGIGIALIAVMFASAGNMLAYKNHLMKVPVMVKNWPSRPQ